MIWQVYVLKLFFILQEFLFMLYLVKKRGIEQSGSSQGS